MRWARLLLLLGLWACGAGPATEPIPPGPEPSASDTAPAVSDADIEAKADELLAGAERLEPMVSRRLAELAAASSGELVGMEHRLKTRGSLLRKIRQHLVLKQMPLEDIDIDDCLRYTLRVEDTPVGHYNQTVAEVLRRLEGDGNTVLKVKNYWPRGDNYSGVNTILRAPNGYSWELQFHTTASLSTQKQGHPLYEEMRQVRTPISRKQQLFDQLSAPWESVAIPAGVLVERSLHPVEQIIKRQRPD